ncbi:hypothetical protein NP493_204g04008 [Ridgeia piscesae]|uniref:Uncharacterized protein n=1 Tax=Ridgeia piscesae TaxID=27915 RepID=A0AAD9UE72_RIDPI|nr:hypothetical protein NP493_204g04008 [Ridgeia piscesae]
MRIFRSKSSVATLELLVVSASLAAILTPPCSAGVYQTCLDACSVIFSNCLKRECPGRRWPLPVTQKCIEVRLICIHDCEAFKIMDLKRK